MEAELAHRLSHQRVCATQRYVHSQRGQRAAAAGRDRRYVFDSPAPARCRCRRRRRRPPEIDRLYSGAPVLRNSCSRTLACKLSHPIRFCQGRRAWRWRTAAPGMPRPAAADRLSCGSRVPRVPTARAKNTNPPQPHRRKLGHRRHARIRNERRTVQPDDPRPLHFLRTTKVGPRRKALASSVHRLHQPLLPRPMPDVRTRIGLAPAARGPLQRPTAFHRRAATTPAARAGSLCLRRPPLRRKRPATADRGGRSNCSHRSRTVQISLIGDGPDRQPLEQAIQDAGLQNHVAILGWQSSQSIRETLLSATALVIPSMAEGLPIVAMEALASRCPVIATNIAAMSELIEPGKNGWLVPSGSASDLAAAMQEAANCDERPIATNGRSTAEPVSSSFIIRRARPRSCCRCCKVPHRRRALK